ncbi:MAG: MFS transporter [Chloroflexi bacterium]|nr:MFS transporter [Chloroflexota bacterium]
MAVEARDVTLLGNQRFRRLLGGRVLTQTAHNALLYALLILVVEKTGSSIYSTLLIVALTLPSLLLAVPAGISADLLPRRAVMVVSNLLRAAVVGALIIYRADIWWVYMLAVGFAGAGQFFAPAESGVVPSLVRREQLTGANSLMNFTLLLGQVAGIMVLAPFLLKTLGEGAVFVLCLVLFVVGSYAIFRVGPLTVPHDDEPEVGFMEAAGKGWQLVRTNRKVFVAILYLTAATMLGKLVVVMAPEYTKEVLRIAPENMVYVAAPAAIGIVSGLLLAPPLARLIGSHRLVVVGFLLFLASLIALGLIVYIRDALETHLHLGLSYVEERVGVSSVISMAMILAIPTGLAFSMLSVGARAALNEEAPAGMQGRVFATQMALGDAASLVPLLAAGAIAELVGVRAVLLAAAAATLLLAEYVRLSRRFGPPVTPAVEPAAGAR